MADLEKRKDRTKCGHADTSVFRRVLLFSNVLPFSAYFQVPVFSEPLYCGRVACPASFCAPSDFLAPPWPRHWHQSARCVLMRYRAVARWTQVQLPQPLHWLQQPRRHRWVARGWTHNAGRRATAIHCSLYNWTAEARVVRPRLRGRTIIQTDERSMMI